MIETIILLYFCASAVLSVVLLQAADHELQQMPAWQHALAMVVAVLFSPLLFAAVLIEVAVDIARGRKHGP